VFCVISFVVDIFFASFFKHGIYKLKISHDSSQLVTLHLDGRISFWSVPSMRLIKTWNKSEQVLTTLPSLITPQMVFSFHISYFSI